MCLIKSANGLPISCSFIQLRFFSVAHSCNAACTIFAPYCEHSSLYLSTVFLLWLRLWFTIRSHVIRKVLKSGVPPLKGSGASAPEGTNPSCAVGWDGLD